jgi:hypothetical protein
MGDINEMIKHAKCNKLTINEICQFCTDCAAFWTVVTRDRAASIFWDRAEDEGGTLHL